MPIDPAQRHQFEQDAITAAWGVVVASKKEEDRGAGLSHPDIPTALIQRPL